MSDLTVLSASQQLQNWIEKEKACGLLDIKFFKGNTDNSSVESFSQAVLDMINAPTVTDPELF